MKIGIQLEMVDQTDGDAETNFADMGRICNPPIAEHQTQMDTHKASIYRHPLFPLLVLLLEKCEQSTQSSDCSKVASFDFDIANFVRNLEKEDKAPFSEDPELDHLMIKAIQVLRIHLLELEKVSDLCKDFCTRYIACLKDKINNETLLSEESDDPSSPLQTQTSSSFSETMNMEGFVHTSAMQHGNLTVTTVNHPHGAAVYQPVAVVTSEGHVMNRAISPRSMRTQISQNNLQLNQGFSFYSTDDSSSKNKRGVLPKQATNVMRSWLFQHITHPYPSEDEKKQIAVQTNLTLLQVNNWFINARRRILPMLDTSFSETAKSKKKTAQKSPLQRFWPDSVASTVSQEQLDMEVGMGVDGFHALSSDGATFAMQQVMMGNHSEEETDCSEDEDYRNQASINMTELGLGVSS